LAKFIADWNWTSSFLSKLNSNSVFQQKVMGTYRQLAFYFQNYKGPPLPSDRYFAPSISILLHLVKYRTTIDK
jgi:hypothetical protein